MLLELYPELVLPELYPVFVVVVLLFALYALCVLDVKLLDAFVLLYVGAVLLL